MAMSKKYSDVYDGVKHKTPMQRMLEEQAKKQKMNKEKEEQEDGTNTKSTSRKSRGNSGTDK
jgi:hypothetical protein